jgi:formaldehyde-activating enzyme
MLVPTRPLKSLRQANMIYGPVQAAVSRAIVDKAGDGAIPPQAMEDELMIVMVTLHPRALDRREVFHNTLEAMTGALDDTFPVGGQR